MKTLKMKFYFALFLSLILTSCGETTQEPESEVLEDDMETAAAESPIDFPLSVQERDALTPDDVVQEFQQGNLQFIKDSLTPRNTQGRIERTGTSQYPKAMVLSCIDSRVPVEEIFNQGLGDIFVGRIAGNFADTEMLGSLEYATKVAGSKVIVVMGHQNCGAVKSAIANVELGNITALLEHIEPAIEMTDGFPEDAQTVKNDEYVNAVIENNVLHTIEKIREESPIIAELEEAGDIKIVGAYYDVTTGQVQFL